MTANVDKRDLSDEDVVSQVVSGNINTYAILIARYETKLQRYVTYLVHDQVGAQDVVQETFLKAYQNLRSFNPKYKFSSWIYRIAHNEAMNLVKTYKHFSNDDIENQPDKIYESRIDEIVDTNLIKGHVSECLNKLEPKYRDVVQLIYFEGMKYDDASDVLHVPPSTIGVWLSRGKTKLRIICEQKGVKR